MIRASSVAGCLVIAALALSPVPGSAGERPAPPEPSIPALIRDLSGQDWLTILRAKEALEARQEKAIPALLALLDRRDVLPLINTIDLIYPGAETFYGHGYIVDYDLDSLAVRAGWVLEAITFQDFGFREGSIGEEALFKAMREHGAGDMPLAEVTGREGPPFGRTRLPRSTALARAWWVQAGPRWTRRRAVAEALDSSSVSRQIEVFTWLRFGTTGCDGYDPRWFEAEVRPRAQKLAKSPDRGVREQAELLLRDGFHLPAPLPEIEGVVMGVR